MSEEQDEVEGKAPEAGAVEGWTGSIEDVPRVATSRFQILMDKMAETAQTKDRAALIRLAESAAEHLWDAVELFYTEAGVTDKDIEQFSSNASDDALFVKLASKPADEKFLKVPTEVDSRQG